MDQDKKPEPIISPMSAEFSPALPGTPPLSKKGLPLVKMTPEKIQEVKNILGVDSIFIAARNENLLLNHVSPILIMLDGFSHTELHNIETIIHVECERILKMSNIHPPKPPAPPVDK